MTQTDALCPVMASAPVSLKSNSNAKVKLANIKCTTSGDEPGDKIRLLFDIFVSFTVLLDK